MGRKTHGVLGPKPAMPSPGDVVRAGVSATVDADSTRDTPPEPVPAVQWQPTYVIELSELWHGRLETLAKRDHVKPADYVEHLIRRAWVASGAGKGQP